MKLLEIKEGQGYYISCDGKAVPIDNIKKEDLLRLVDLTLENDVEFDEFSEEHIKNPAHQIVYRNIYEKLVDLRDRKQEFKDETENLYIDAFEKYCNEGSQ